MNKKANCIVSLSGGMDSTTVLLKCLKDYEKVVAVSFDYGQKHKVELERAKELIQYLKSKEIDIIYEVVQLKGLSNLLYSTLVEGGDEVPEGHYQEESMRSTVVPNRNKIFSSITQAIALSVANQTEQPTDIALGIHSGDHEIYPDCRQEFRDADELAFRTGNWNSDRVYFVAPYLHTDKLGILKDGEVLCAELGLDFDEVYKRTNTSYKPMKVKVDMGMGYVKWEWMSDYKSASSVERVEAFIALGRPDPVAYADETGPVSWEKVVEEVKKVLELQAGK